MQDKIDHVIVLMLENRSLDNVLGWLYADQQPQLFMGADTTSVFRGLQTGSYSNQYDDRVIPATHGTTGATGHDGVPPQPIRVPGFDPGEAYAHVNQQLFGSPSAPTTKNPPSGTPAAMAGFAYDYDASYESWQQLDQIMEAYTPAQLPILNGLAQAYAVSDAWHASVPTETNPNRAFSLCGTSLGRVDNTWDAVEQFKTKTIWNALPAGTSWGIYYHDIWHDKQCYTQYTFPNCNDALADGKIESIDTFYAKARDGSLPRLSYLEPKWGYGMGKPDGSGFYCGKILGKTYGSQGNDYHPPTWMGPGEVFVNQVYEALVANTDKWQRTLLIITFDEHGGTYDHVDPGWGAIPPDDESRPRRVRVRSLWRTRPDPAGLTVGTGWHGVPIVGPELEVRSHLDHRHGVELVRRRSGSGRARRSGRRGSDLRMGARRPHPPGRPDVHRPRRLRRPGEELLGHKRSRTSSRERRTLDGRPERDHRGARDAGEGRRRSAVARALVRSACGTVARAVRLPRRTTRTCRPPAPAGAWCLQAGKTVALRSDIEGPAGRGVAGHRHRRGGSCPASRAV